MQIDAGVLQNVVFDFICNKGAICVEMFLVILMAAVLKIREVQRVSLSAADLASIP